MRAFTDLYTALDETTKTNAKVDALVKYFQAVPPEDAVWAIHFLIGRRIKRLIETRKLVAWAIEEAGIPEWIFGDCYSAVGDLAETIALLLPSPIAQLGKIRCATGWKSGCCRSATGAMNSSASRLFSPGAKWTSASGSSGTS